VYSLPEVTCQYGEPLDVDFAEATKADNEHLAALSAMDAA
jgi:hypothetical protein